MSFKNQADSPHEKLEPLQQPQETPKGNMKPHQGRGSTEGPQNLL